MLDISFQRWNNEKSGGVPENCSKCQKDKEVATSPSNSLHNTTDYNFPHYKSLSHSLCCVPVQCGGVSQFPYCESREYTAMQ